MIIHIFILDIGDPGNKKQVEWLVRHIGEEELEPDTKYVFWVRGENSHPNVNGAYVETYGKTYGRCSYSPSLWNTRYCIS